MAKRKKHPETAPKKPSRTLAFEDSPWFVPAVFAVLFLALVILFSSFLFSDKMLYGSDTINAGIFMRSLLIDHVSEHGSIPKWNPYIFGGMPYVDAFHGDIFYPLSFIKFFGSLYRTLGINLFLHIFLAGILMYLCARRFRLTKIPSLMAAACYMFSPYLVSLVAPGHDGKIFVTTLFPMIFFFLESGFETSGYRRFFHFSMMGLVIGFIILSPHPQMSYFMLWAAALYTIYKMVFVWRRTGNLIEVGKPGVLALYAVVVGLFLSAIQFYPGYIYTTEFSPRADSKSGWEWATSWSMHEEETLGLLIPEFPGANSEKAGTTYWGKNAFKDNSESAGIVALFLGLIGLFFSRRKKAWFFGGLALFALLYALADTTPVFRLFYWLIPKVKSLRAPAMIMFLFAFSFSMLAGMGLQWIREQRSKRAGVSSRFNYLLWGFPALMLVLALLISVGGAGFLNAWSDLFYDQAASRQIQRGVTKLDLAVRMLPDITAGAWLGFLFSLLAAAGVWLYRVGKAGTAVLVALVAIPVVDGVRFNSRFIDTFDADQYFSGNPVTQFFQQTPGHFRVMNFGILPETMLPLFGQDVVVGYHGNQLRWYDQLLGGPSKANQGNPGFLNLAGAEYLLLPGGQQLPANFLGPEPTTKAAAFGQQAQIIHNPNALPRVRLYADYEVLQNREEIHARILERQADLQSTLLLEQEPALEITAVTNTTVGETSDSAWIVDYALDSVLVGVASSQNQLLLLADNYYDSWHVYVDGEPAELLRAFGTFRAVAIPAGSEQVLFRYDSSRYATGKLVTILTSLWLLAVIGIQIWRSRTAGRNDEAESEDR